MTTTNNYNRIDISEAATKGIPPKRIVVCCDGTWQSATSTDPTKAVESNVARLCRAVAAAGTDRNDSSKIWTQIAYYDAGVGTGDLTDFEKKRQGGLGIGLIENVLEAYNFIVSNYCPGDELFFFGFSRGAFTVRSAAGLVSTIGVIRPCYMQNFIRHYTGWQKYLTEHEGEQIEMTSYKPWMEFAQNNDVFITKATAGTVEKQFQDAKPVVQVVGVWDTVGSLGVPDMGHWLQVWKSDTAPYKFHDVDLNDRIKHAYQALALDERRGAFSPSMWKIKKQKAADGTDLKPATRLVQCWFPGAHVNVGGGSSSNVVDETNKKTPKGDAEQLATISYAWMLDRIRPHLALDQHAIDVQFAPFEKFRVPENVEKKENRGLLLGAWDWFSPPQKPLVTGYARGHIDDSFGLQYWAMGMPKNRTPGKYHDPAAEFTTERIHPSVFFRQEATKKFGDQQYKPYALQDWVRIKEGNGIGRDGKTKREGWKWVKYTDPKNPKEYGDDWLWEFEIGDLPENKGMEARLMKGSWIDDINADVKAGWK